jgi:glutamyl-tRNA synthetase
MAVRGVELDESRTDEKVVTSLAARSKTLVEMADQALFYYQDEIGFDPDADRKFLTAEALPALKSLTAKLSALEDYDEPALEEIFKAVMAETGLKLGKIAQPVRVALSGRAASPGIFEIIAIIGKAKTLRRLGRAIEYIERK